MKVIKRETFEDEKKIKEARSGKKKPGGFFFGTDKTGHPIRKFYVFRKKPPPGGFFSEHPGFFFFGTPFICSVKFGTCKKELYMTDLRGNLAPIRRIIITCVP